MKQRLTYPLGTCLAALLLTVSCKSAKLSTALTEIEKGEYFKASQTL